MNETPAQVAPDTSTTSESASISAILPDTVSASSPCEVRRATEADLPHILRLYGDMHDEDILSEQAARPLWQRILADPDQRVLLACAGEHPVASCILLIVPNLSRGGRPWALIENVVTAHDQRRKGYGSALLARARALAEEANCYKIMLLTGRRDAATLNFYRTAGYDENGKTGFAIKL